MLQTISDFLQTLLDKEKEFLSKQDITHPGIIGDMYEGLAKEILNKAIFQGLNLSVRDGFVRGPDKKLSKQIDCMIVEGEGELIPHTNHYVYDFENVIAILESKKTLYSEELSEAYANLLSFSDRFNPSTKMNIKYSDLVQPFQEITKKEFPKDPKTLNEKDQLIYHYLVIMYAMPLRIIFGYNGYETELGFRDGYVNYLEKRMGQKHYGPNSMPDLIICNDYSIIKINQQPYQIQSLRDNFFTLFATGVNKPIYYLLLQLWYKLQFRYNLSPEIWDDGSDSLLQVKRYIDVRLGRRNINEWGWEYKYFHLTHKELEDVPPKENWEPFIVSKNAWIVAQMFKDRDIIENITNVGIPELELNSIIKELCDTGLFILDNQKLICNAKYLVCFMDRYHNYICDNNDGDIEIWLKRNKAKQ